MFGVILVVVQGIHVVMLGAKNHMAFGVGGHDVRADLNMPESLDAPLGAHRGTQAY